MADIKALLAQTLAKYGIKSSDAPKPKGDYYGGSQSKGSFFGGAPKKPYVPPEKWESAGGVIFNEKGHVALIKPKGEYGGYAWTFPKGRIEHGETPQDAAHREIAEESGLKGEIVGHLGRHEGTMSHTRYFLMKHTGSGATQDGETEHVEFVHPKDARLMLNSSRDRKVLDLALSHDGLPAHAEDRPEPMMLTSRSGKQYYVTAAGNRVYVKKGYPNGSGK
jgi:ADP-ribose pyrophosphatase YjhB (NUDIX family)